MPIFAGCILAIMALAYAAYTAKALFKDNDAFSFVICLVISVATGFGSYYSFGATS